MVFVQTGTITVTGSQVVGVTGAVGATFLYMSNQDGFREPFDDYYDPVSPPYEERLRPPTDYGNPLGRPPEDFIPDLGSRRMNVEEIIEWMKRLWRRT